MQREKSAREKQAEETKLRIRNSAFELFREKGYNNTSIEEILKRSNSSIGGFYLPHTKVMEQEVFKFIFTVVTGICKVKNVR